MSETAAPQGTEQQSTTQEQGQGQTQTQQAPGTGEQTEQVDVQALRDEIERWKQLSRKNEDRAKSNAQAHKELERLKQASMSEQERAVAQARDEARTEATREMGGRLVAAELRGVLKGRLSDDQTDALLDRVDKTRFLTDDGEPDAKEIAKFADAVAPAKSERDFPDLGQGVRQPAPRQADMNQIIRAAKFGQ